MVDFLLDDKRPKIMGHRGSGRGVVGGHAENTLGSVRAAVEWGAEWIEVDVRRTRDDGLVVLHNPTCESGSFVSDLTAAEPDASALLKLTELIAILPDGIGLNVDIKSSLEDAARARSATTAALVAAVAAAEAERRPLIVTSFDAAALLIVRDLAPGVPLGLLTWVGFPMRKAVPMAAHLGVNALIAHVSSFGPNRIDPAPVHRTAEYSMNVAHESGLAVGAWCPEPDSVVDLFRAGADLAVVNDVPGTLAAIRANGGVATGDHASRAEGLAAGPGGVAQ